MAYPVVKPPEHPVEKGDSVLGEVKVAVCAQWITWNLAAVGT